MRAVALALTVLLLAGMDARAHGQAQAARLDPIVQTLRDLEAALSAERPGALAALMSPQLPPAQAVLLNEIRMDDRADRARVTVRERERRPAAGGSLVIIDLLVSRGVAGRLVTWEIDLRPSPSATDRLVVTGLRPLAQLDGLTRLSLDTTRQFSVHNLAFTAPDFVLTMASGTAFTASAESGITALVLSGRGEVHFTPPDPAEQDQLRIFSRHPSIASSVDDVYIRVNPTDLASHLMESSLVPTPARPGVRAAAHAQEIFDRFSSKSFNLNLGDLSQDRWSILPVAGSVAVEFKAARYGWLTYARSINDAEDVTLFDRRRAHNLSLYASTEKIAERGRFYDEDAGAAYDVVEYGLDVTFDPQRMWIGGRGRLRIRLLSDGLQSVPLRLAESLAVSSVTSPGLGRLLATRVLGQTTVLVSLPTPVDRDQELTFDIAYSGRLDPQNLGDEAMSTPAQGQPPEETRELSQRPEPRFTYSSRAYWYPQGVTTDYAPATMRLTVPVDFQIVASGTPVRSSVAQAVLRGESRSWRTVEFVADRPIRYLACEISRFVSLGRTAIQVPVTDATDRIGAAAAIAKTSALPLEVLATPRLAGINRGLAARIDAVVRFFADQFGAVPYPSLTITAADALLPGGHSPAYFALIQQPLPSTPYAWRDDPLNLDRYPDVLLAHEVAHQWWGQAVGFKNYHEQWLSEGLAHYSAVMFLESTRPDLVRGLLQHMRASAQAFSSKGPIYLGYRLGHIEGRGATFRAITYNKSATVLHMLRRMIGDEAFRNGLRRFYREWRFKKAGTDDLRAAFEAEARRPLGRFFDRWVLGSTLPRVRVTAEGGREPGSATVRVEQLGDVFDFPLTITVQYADGRTEDRTLVVTETVRDYRLAVSGEVRKIVTKDDLTLAEWEK